jgi:probable F420-dependent oxidoreductase
MNIGVVFPQTEFGNDPIAVRDYAQTAEDLGYTHVVAYDHILGANPNRPGGWQGPYTYQSAFHEPFVLFSYLAAITQKLGLVPGIIILPQRQTALVAKQAATLDVLSGGRLRLGVGLGWNQVEYIALGEDFHNRGRRMEEQITVLRQLWTQPLVNVAGQWHTIPDAGINPLPVQRPIPIWFGGRSPAALSRAARLGEGWLSNYATLAEAQPALEHIARSLDEAGRTRAEFGIEARLPYGDGNAAAWTTLIRDWQAAGATHASLNTMGVGFDTPAAHLAALRKFAKAIKP